MMILILSYFHSAYILVLLKFCSSQFMAGKCFPGEQCGPWAYCLSDVLLTFSFFSFYYFYFQPCRFGMQCMNKSTCTFYHPPVPSKSQLKWTAISKQTSTHIRYAKQKFSHLLHVIFAT